MGFLLSSVEKFFGAHREQVDRGANFSQVLEEEKSDILRRARRLATMGQCCQQEISRRIGSPAEVVRPGDLVRVRVVAIDPERRRLSLSVRQAAGNVVYATRTEQDANV